MVEPTDYQVFEILQKKNYEYFDFLSFKADYFGEIHLTAHDLPSKGVNEDGKFKSRDLYTFDNKHRVSVMKKSLFDDSQILIGDIEGNLKMLKLDESFKKNKYGASLSLLSHSDNLTNFKRINDICWISKHHLVMLGNDNSINVIEPSTLQCSFRINTKFSTPFVCDNNKSNNDIVNVGFEDGYIKLFDLRKNQKKADKLFKSHNKAVSVIKFSPYDENLFLSGGMDGISKVWDVRSDLPLFSVSTTFNTKIFDLNWISSNEFVTGGDDSAVTFHSLTDN